jgi:hypothetical protein
MKWEDGIKVEHREIGYEDEKWMQLTQDRGQCWALVLTKSAVSLLVFCGSRRGSLLPVLHDFLGGGKLRFVLTVLHFIPYQFMDYGLFMDYLAMLSVAYVIYIVDWYDD